MKYCPECNFSFPDFHQLCDFDGTALLPENEQLSENEQLQVINARPSRLRYALQSPLFLSVLAAIALLSTGILIGYLDSIRQSPPLFTKKQATTSLSDTAQAWEQAPVARRRLARVFHHNKKNLNRLPFSVASARREATPVHPAARKQDRIFTSSRPQSSETARNRESQQISNNSAAKVSATRNVETNPRRDPQPIPHQKDPKLTAMLKSTWHVLKKPFKF